MQYDRDGFPIPPAFDPAADRDSFGNGFGWGGGKGQPAPAPETPGSVPGRRPKKRKRAWLLLLVAAGLVPAVVVPEVMPAVRQGIVEWALERAAVREAGEDVPGAIADLGTALYWHGDDPDLLCMRALLRLEDRDPAGAIEDATQAAMRAPLSPQPARVRALAAVVAGNVGMALADAGMVVDLSAPGDPEALNHRAYIRALVGRELPEALADIERAIGTLGESSPELLDTRGFILHLLDRQAEAIDQLNLAIDTMQQNRRQLRLLSGRMERSELIRRMRALDRGLAVMLHHRALACAEAGLVEQAAQDGELARKKGFDPARGIF
jgi:tetratricopeptide (TPR) repeat protein